MSYRLQINGISVECDTVDEAFAITGLSRPTEDFPSVPAPLPASFPPKAAIPAMPLPKGSMAPTGKTKKCKGCKRSFPVLTRRDCAALRCPECRGDDAPTPPPAPPRQAPAKRTPDVAAAKGLLGRAPIRPTEPTKPCSSCGDKTRVSDLDRADRCRNCQPIGEPA